MYSELVTAFKASGIPFAETAWANAPQTGSYGVIQLDFGADAVWADGSLIHQALSGSVDVFVRGSEKTVISTVQSVFAAQGVGFKLSSVQYESERRIVHYEWVFELEAL